MILELKMDKDYYDGYSEAYRIGGVKGITNKTKYGCGHFAITIFDTSVFITELFEYVKDADSGKYYVKDGKWVGDNDKVSCKECSFYNICKLDQRLNYEDNDDTWLRTE
jgi:hypothetical protein